MYMDYMYMDFILEAIMVTYMYTYMHVQSNKLVNAC